MRYTAPRCEDVGTGVPDGPTGRLPPLQCCRKITVTVLPPSDEGGVGVADGGREKPARVAEDAGPCNVANKIAVFDLSRLVVSTVKNEKFFRKG